MNADECLTEEWWNVLTNAAYAVPLWYVNASKRPSTYWSIVAVMVCSTLRHLPRDQVLGGVKQLRDGFRGADFTSVGLLLGNMANEIPEQPSPEPHLLRLLGVGYAAVVNSLFFTLPSDFPWSVAVYYYAPVLVYIVGWRREFLSALANARGAGLLLLIFVVCVLLRMTEHKSVAPTFGFDEGGTTCIPDHGMWHIGSALLLAYILYPYNES